MVFSERYSLTRSMFSALVRPRNVEEWSGRYTEIISNLHLNRNEGCTWGGVTVSRRAKAITVAAPH
jgi:hypothetical protein